MPHTDEQPVTKKERRELKRAEKEQGRKAIQKTRLFKRVYLWAIIVVVSGGAVFGLIKLGSSIGSKQNLPLASAVSATDWTRGSKTADIVLIEYGDFQCPACAAFYPMMAQLEREFGDDIQVVFRHFPLQQIHANAGIAAQAAEAAGLQGKFWEMHDMLFEHQQEWSNRKDAEDIFMQYAQRIDLDIEGFKRDIDLSSIKKKIEDDYRSGIASGVSGTPTIFLNGNNIRNPRSYNELRDIVRSLFKGEAEQ